MKVPKNRTYCWDVFSEEIIEALFQRMEIKQDPSFNNYSELTMPEYGAKSEFVLTVEKSCSFTCSDLLYKNFKQTCEYEIDQKKIIKIVRDMLQITDEEMKDAYLKYEKVNSQRLLFTLVTNTPVG